MDKKYIVSWNGSIDNKLMSLEEVKESFKKDGVESWWFDSEESYEIVEVDFDKGIEMLIESFDGMKCYNDELFSMGDDYCELNIEEVKV